MKKVNQTKLGRDEGNCFAACVASLLEIDIEDIPDLDLCRGDWTKPLNEWLATLGFGYVEAKVTKPCLYPVPPGLLCILSGVSPRMPDCEHAVVGRANGTNTFDVIHDPHPSHNGLAGNVTGVGFLLPLVPVLQGDDSAASSVQEMVAEWLKAHGFDGLFNGDGECACQRDDLAPGDCEGIGGCGAGYLGPCDCGEHDWHICREKPEAGANDLAPVGADSADAAETADAKAV